MSHLRLVYSGEPEVVDAMTRYCRELKKLRERQNRERAEEAAQAEADYLRNERLEDWRRGRGPNPDECSDENYNWAYSLWGSWPDPEWRGLDHAERVRRFDAMKPSLSRMPPPPMVRP